MFRSKALRPIAGVVLVTFTALTLEPLTAAAQLPSPAKRTTAQSDSGEERFSRTLNEIHEILKEVVPQAAMLHMFGSAAPTVAGKPGEKVLQAVGPKMRLESERAKPLPGVDVTAKVKALRGKYKELKSLEAEVDKGFKATEKHIRDKNLPPEILARHEAAVAEYDKRKAEFGTLMAAVEAAADGKGELQPALSSLGEFMAKYPNAKTHTPTDPDNLPWGSPKPVTRAPYTSPAQFKTSRLFGETVKVAQAGNLSGISLPNTALPLTPTPADLAATEDVQFTQAIKDLATSLSNNPVKIYNWVRNSIQFVPSYGSMQGSDMTLQTRRGNAFDTANLLIALLRSAGVPARYVYGTIEVPVDKAMNWVGGVTVPQAAQSLMGQGGIPNVGIGSAGQIRFIRLEHVWVEAFVDYVPSRGAVNRNPNTWVPLDASFKQYRFTQGMDLKTNVPFDAQSFLTQVQQGTIVNEAEGWVSNVNQNLQTKLTNYQVQVTNYVNTQKANATTADVLGNQTIVQQNSPILLGTLPYRTIVTGPTVAVLPDSLKWRWSWSLSDPQSGTVLASFDRPTTQFARKKLILSFVPATQADIDLIRSLLPNLANGQIDPAVLPTSLPGYLLKVKPQLRIDGAVVAEGPPLSMGSEVRMDMAYTDPIRGLQTIIPIALNAGEADAIWLDLQGVARSDLSALNSRLARTQGILAAYQADPNSTQTQEGVTGLTADDLAGDVLYANILGYFASIDEADQLTARTSGTIVTYRLPSFGRFGVAVQPRFFFGVVRSVNFPGTQMDINYLVQQTEAKDGDSIKRVAFLRQAGAMGSGLEGSVPDQIFAAPNNFVSDPTQLQGVSAIEAICLAMEQGQKVYVFSQATHPQYQAILANLSISQSAKGDILNTLAQGGEVTVHERDITVRNWTGSGYILIDPITGAGAYRIDGGANGAFKLLSTAAFLATFLFVPLSPLFLVFFFASFFLSLAAIFADCADSPSRRPVSIAILYMTLFALIPMATLVVARSLGVVADFIDRIVLSTSWRAFNSLSTSPGIPRECS